jgi:hypothetical protein
MGSPRTRAADMGNMSDDVLGAAINNPSGKAATVRIYNGVVEEGNHRMREALTRMADPNNSAFTEDTMVNVINVVA